MMTNELDISCILKLLPHRYPFLLVDKIIEVNKGQNIVALKNVTISEPYFQGHFPDQPVMPGVLQLEALAQTSGMLALLSQGLEAMPEDSYIYLAGIDGCRFRQPVLPGDQLLLHAELKRTVRNISRYAVRATVADKTVCEAELTIAGKRGQDS